LDALSTTSVEFRSDLQHDDLVIDGMNAAPQAVQRVSTFLDIIRARMPEKNLKAIVISDNNFPMGAGIASSASAFAALAAAQAAGLANPDLRRCGPHPAHDNSFAEIIKGIDN